MMAKMNIKIVFVVALVSLLMGMLIEIGAAAPPKPELPKSVAIAAHPKGSLMNILASGLAKVISSHTPISAVDRPYTGYSVWLPLTDRGSVDMCLATNRNYHLSYRGMYPYKEKLKNLRQISGGTILYTGYIARADSGMKTIADLKGKRATISPDTFGAYHDPRTLIRAAGLDPDKDVTLVPAAGVTACLDLFMEGRVDASWTSVGTAKTKEAAAKLGGLTWLSVCGSYDDDRARFIRKNSPGVDVAFVKAGILPEVKNDFWFLKQIVCLATHKDMSEEAIYQITKAIWENHDELAKIHPQLKTWFPNMINDSGAFPYHRGAVRFYKEVGAWTDKMEKIQRKVLQE
jgi:TRAP transporter TAXI family solute receptor